MTSHQPVAAPEEHQVLKFRPRTSDMLRDDEAVAPVEADMPDDFKHRMWTNAAAFAFTVSLTAFGIWIAVLMSDVRTKQDCVLMGRRDCARVATPSGTTEVMAPTHSGVSRP